MARSEATPSPRRQELLEAAYAHALRSGLAEPFGIQAGENPLLQAWGEAGRDFMAVLGDYEVVHPSGEIAAYVDPESIPVPGLDDGGLGDSLLHRLQADLYQRGDDHRWQHLRLTAAGDTLPLRCLDAQPSLREVYTDVPQLLACE